MRDGKGAGPKTAIYEHEVKQYYPKLNEVLNEVAAREMVAVSGAIVGTDDNRWLVQLSSRDNAASFRRSLQVYNPSYLATDNAGIATDTVSVTENFARIIINLNPGVRFAVGIANRNTRSVGEMLLGRKDKDIESFKRRLIKAHAFVVSPASTNLGRLFVARNGIPQTVAELMRNAVRGYDFLGTNFEAQMIAFKKISFNSQILFEITPLPTPCRVALSRIPESKHHIRSAADANPLEVAANQIFADITNLADVSAPRQTDSN